MSRASSPVALYRGLHGVLGSLTPEVGGAQPIGTRWMKKVLQSFAGLALSLMVWSCFPGAW